MVDIKDKSQDRIVMFSRLIIVWMGVFFLAQIGNATPRADKKGVSGKKPAVETQQQEPEKKVEKYIYNPAGKTDPFESFLVKTKKSSGRRLSAGDSDLEEAEAVVAEGEPRTELERIELSKLTLTSIIRGESKVVAMVVDPKGRGYFLEKGTKVGTQNGVVDEIISEQKETDMGPEVVKKVVIKVPYRDRNKNIIYRSIDMEIPSNISM